MKFLPRCSAVSSAKTIFGNRYFGGQTSIWRSDLQIILLALLIMPEVVSAQVVISEIMYDISGSDSKAEWIELQNTGAQAIDISKWKLHDGSNHVFNAPPKNGSSGSLVLEPGAYLILASDAATFRATETVSVSVIDTVMSLGNDGGSISLVHASSSVVDTVSYSKATGGNGSGESLQKISDAFIAAKPTPGRANSSDRIPVSVPMAKTTKKTAVKSAAKESSEAPPIHPDAASTSADILAEASESNTTAFAAAAVVPVGAQSSSFMPWAYGALAIGIAGAGAVLVSRQKKKGEWDIDEIST